MSERIDRLKADIVDLTAKFEAKQDQIPAGDFALAMYSLERMRAGVNMLERGQKLLPDEDEC